LYLIIQAIKARRMVSLEHVACRGEWRGFWWGNRRVRGQLEDPDVDGRIILRYLQEVRCGGVDWIDVAGCFKRGNDSLGSIKLGNFLANRFSR
jgi:hypothetical protein